MLSGHGASTAAVAYGLPASDRTADLDAASGAMSYAELMLRSTAAAMALREVQNVGVVAIASVRACAGGGASVVADAASGAISYAELPDASARGARGSALFPAVARRGGRAWLASG